MQQNQQIPYYSELKTYIDFEIETKLFEHKKLMRLKETFEL